MAKAVAIAEGGRGPKLTEAQEILLDAVRGGLSMQEACQLAGYVNAGMLAAATRSEHMQNALKSAVQSRLKGTGLVKAAMTMESLMEPGNPAATRFSAAKWISETAGVGPKGSDDGRDKDPVTMTEAELLALIERAQRAYDEAGEPPVVIVAPRDGA